MISILFPVFVIRLVVGAKFTKLHFVTQLVVHLLPDWASLQDPSVLFAQSSSALLFALSSYVCTGMCDVGQNLISSYYDAEILQFPQRSIPKPGQLRLGPGVVLQRKWKMFVAMTLVY